MSEGQGLFPVVELPEFEEAGEEYDREYISPLRYGIWKKEILSGTRPIRL